MSYYRRKCSKICKRLDYLRDNVVIHEGNLKLLKRFKDEVENVQSGQECGMAFSDYEDIKADDVIEIFKVDNIARTIN